MKAAEPLVIDSSIAVKWFKTDGEDQVENAVALLERHRDGETILVAPAHLTVEVLNGLRYSSLGEDDTRLAIHYLHLAGLLLVPIDADLLTTALDLALAYDLTIYDAIFPALAMRFECGLVTADRKQACVAECPVRLLA